MQGKRGFGIKTVILVAVVSIVAGIALTTRLDLTTQTTAENFWKESTAKKVREAAPTGLPSFVELSQKLSPTVVNISTTQVVKGRPMAPFPDFKGPFDDFFGDEFKDFFDNGPHREFKKQSLGSGFVINKEGFILTNQHVIANATEIIVTLSEGKKNYEAEVIGQDKKLDIALIKISADQDLPVATLGDSDALEIGEWVMAIGNPFGLGGSVTAGIISQKGRVIGAGPYDDFLQTDASINPGNSGGPLFNIKGEVVGINTAIIAGGQGIGFATPINQVKEILVQLKETGKVTRGWIGVTIQEVTPELARSFGLESPRGALVSSVNPGDPADEAGIKAGDVIVSFGGEPIDELNDLPRVVANTAPGVKSEVKVIRDGREKTVFVEVGTREEEKKRELLGRDEKAPDEKIGITVQPVTPEIARRLDLETTDGVIISSVEPASPASEAGLRRGDVIREINRAPITDMDNYAEEMTKAAEDDVILLLVQRGQSTLYVVLKLKEK